MPVMGMLAWSYETPRETSVTLALLLHMAQALQPDMLMHENLM